MGAGGIEEGYKVGTEREKMGQKDRKKQEDWGEWQRLGKRRNKKYSKSRTETRGT